MPPRGHSSSSHRSSSSHSSSSRSSSSRSSSSHRSSSSSSSSFRSSSSSSRSSSGPSRRSSLGGAGLGALLFGAARRPSPHSTSTHKDSVQSSSANRRTASTVSARPPRERRSQPTGFIAKDRSHKIVRYYGAKHDYVYYPNDWITAEGISYQRGYYDENGVRYSNVAVENKAMLFTCEYCGSQINAVWKEGESLTCPNCGAQVRVDIVDTLDGGQGSTGYGTAPYAPTGHYSGNNNQYSSVNAGQVVSRTRRTSIFGIVIAIAAICIAASYGIISKQRDQIGNDYGITSNQQVTSQQGSTTTTDRRSSIYVEEIGRTCYLDGEDYYDRQTQCWFYYNDDAGCWQYWYEEVSSKYGDYGWMEYDNDEQVWYIEVDAGDWIVLPEDEYKDYLWYIDEW